MLEAYKEFVDKQKETVICRSFAPYRWYKLPDSLPGHWMPYGLMLGEHARELANSLNEFLRYINTLSTWKEVIGGKNDSDKHEIVIEFIVPFATLAVNLPYVIRSRFIYSVAHLSHQANQTNQTNWVDDLPIDTAIYFEAADKYAAQWKSYKKLKLALEQIANKKYQSNTFDFRNKYNHRYSPRIEVGLTGLVTRNVKENGQVSYGVGQTNPIKLNDIVPLLIDQHSKCLRAFEQYQKLISEQISTITKAQQQR